MTCTGCVSRGFPSEHCKIHRSDSKLHCPDCYMYKTHKEGCSLFGTVVTSKQPKKDPMGGWHTNAFKLEFIFFTIVGSGKGIPSSWFDSFESWLESMVTGDGGGLLDDAGTWHQRTSSSPARLSWNSDACNCNASSTHAFESESEIAHVHSSRGGSKDRVGNANTERPPQHEKVHCEGLQQTLAQVRIELLDSSRCRRAWQRIRRVYVRRLRKERQHFEASWAAAVG